MPMPLHVFASAEELLRQASMTAEVYLIEAVRCIDKQFGEGYAKKNPALIASFISTSATDFNTAMSKAGMQDLTDALRKIADQLGSE